MFKRDVSFPIVNIRPWKFPAAEQPMARRVHAALGILPKYVTKFEAALMLFEKCREEQQKLDMMRDPNRQIYSEWKSIAARDGAMTVRHVQQILQLLNNIDAPTLRGLINEPYKKTANRLMAAKFSKIARVRNSVGHSAQFHFKGNTTIQRSLPAIGLSLGREAAVAITEGIQGDVYMTTIDNEVVEYANNEASLNTLAEIALAIKRAFEPAQQFSLRAKPLS